MFARGGTRPIELWRAFLTQAPGWYVWATFTPLIAWLGQRFPLARPVRARSVAAHFAAYLLVAVAGSAAWAAVGQWLRPSRSGYLVSLRGWFLSGLPFTVLTYAAVLGISSAIAHRARLRARETDAARLAQQLAEAQLASLRMQLRPHFLFNSLNAIMALVRGAENDRALTALGLLGDALRATLRTTAVHEVPLAEEVAFTRRYLELERLRFAARLQVSFDVPPALLDAAVPAFVLQPFVENAIKHGIINRIEGGAISVSASAEAGALCLAVRDDGVGLAPGWDAAGRGGLGVSNARLRLEHMYGSAASLRLANAGGGPGVAVDILVPLHRYVATGHDSEETPA